MGLRIEESLLLHSKDGACCSTGSMNSMKLNLSNSIRKSFLDRLTHQFPKSSFLRRQAERGIILTNPSIPISTIAIRIRMVEIAIHANIRIISKFCWEKLLSWEGFTGKAEKLCGDLRFRNMVMVWGFLGNIISCETNIKCYKMRNEYTYCKYNLFLLSHTQ